MGQLKWGHQFSQLKLTHQSAQCANYRQSMSPSRYRPLSKTHWPVESSREWKFHGAKVPQNFRSWSEKAWEREGQGTNSPGNERTRERKLRERIGSVPPIQSIFDNQTMSHAMSVNGKSKNSMIRVIFTASLCANAKQSQRSLYEGTGCSLYALQSTWNIVRTNVHYQS